MGGIVLLAVPAVSAVALAERVDSRLVARLAARDPGARVGGSTIVATGVGARVYGGGGRPNFMAALGSRETIVGGGRGDNLGALGDHATIIGGGGNDVLYGDRDATLVGGGGQDLLVNRGANSTIRAGSGDTVIAEGRHDRVLCTRGSHNVTIYDDRSTSISPTCRAHHGRVLAARTVGQSARAVAVAAAGEPLPSPGVTGAGSNDNPFTANCNTPGPDCINTFPARWLRGAWANEYVPAYKCPGAFPYLLRKFYNRILANVGPGVEIHRNTFQLGTPIDVKISFNSYFEFPILLSGTLTGFPNSSATNWLWDLGEGGTGGRNFYQVILHCTNDRFRALGFYRSSNPYS